MITHLFTPAIRPVRVRDRKIDRVPVPDLCCLWAEEETTPMIIALVATVEGGPLTDASGRVRVERVRRHVVARLHRAPMLRRVLLPTRLVIRESTASPAAWPSKST